MRAAMRERSDRSSSASGERSRCAVTCRAEAPVLRSWITVSFDSGSSSGTPSPRGRRPTVRVWPRLGVGSGCRSGERLSGSKFQNCANSLSKTDKLLTPRYQQGAQRPIDAGFGHQAHPLDGADGVSSLLGAYEQAVFAQRSAKAREVGDEVVAGMDS